MSGRIGGVSPECLSVTASPAPVAGKQATRQEGYLYPKRQGFHPLWMVRLVPEETPLAEVSNTVRLAYVGLALYWSRFDSSYIKPYIFRNGS